MFDIGWSEMAVVVVIALLVLGPKQLPEALRTITKLTRQARRYAQDFRSGIDSIVREAELEEAREALKSVKSANPTKALSDLVDPTGEMDKEMKDLEDTARKETASIKAGASAESGKDKAEGEESKVVKAPAAVAPGNSIRPPAGPDIFAATPPKSEAAKPEAAKPEAAKPEAAKPEPVKSEPAKDPAPQPDAKTQGDEASEAAPEPAKEDERRQA